MDLRALSRILSQKQLFVIPLSEYAIATQLYPDKFQLRSTILDMGASSMSYRQIGKVMGIHWTRVQQIVKGSICESVDRLSA
jgi:hypothetical protein